MNGAMGVWGSGIQCKVLFSKPVKEIFEENHKGLKTQTGTISHPGNIRSSSDCNLLTHHPGTGKECSRLTRPPTSKAGGGGEMSLIRAIRVTP